MPEPTDLETRLTEALEHGSQGAPPAAGLASAARTRARRKRRTRIAGGVALVALAVGVPSAVVATGGDDRPGGDGVGPAGSTAIDDNGDDGVNSATGYHWESWHGVTLQVPNTWGYGNPAAWCANGGDLDTPLVWRPEGATESIGCDPGFGYGLVFQQLEDDSGDDDFEWPVVHQTGGGWPEENVVGGRAVDGVLATVTTRKSTVATYILDSMRAIGPEGDPNGCAATRDAPPAAVPDGGMSVCRYDETGLLQQSELLAADDTEAATSALDGTSLYADDLGCHQPRGGMPAVIMRSGDVDVVVELAGSCPVVRGLGGPPRAVSPDVLYWALSPGWSGDGTNLSLPPELRQR